MGTADEEVRRRLQARLVSAGVSEREVAMEVLWWLPREFVDDYEVLFLKALNLGDGSKGSGGGVGAGVKAVKSELRGKKGSMSAAGGGKKYKTQWIVRDEMAMEVKTRVDRRLRGLVRGMARQVKEEYRAAQGNVKVVREGKEGRGGEGKFMEASQGVLVEKNFGGKGREKVRRCCRDCGRIAADEWARCPFPHA